VETVWEGMVNIKGKGMMHVYDFNFTGNAAQAEARRVSRRRWALGQRGVFASTSLVGKVECHSDMPSKIKSIRSVTRTHDTFLPLKNGTEARGGTQALQAGRGKQRGSSYETDSLSNATGYRNDATGFSNDARNSDEIGCLNEIGCDRQTGYSHETPDTAKQTAAGTSNQVPDTPSLRAIKIEGQVGHTEERQLGHHRDDAISMTTFASGLLTPQKTLAPSSSLRSTRYTKHKSDVFAALELEKIAYESWVRRYIYTHTHTNARTHIHTYTHTNTHTHTHTRAHAPTHVQHTSSQQPPVTPPHTYTQSCARVFRMTWIEYV